MSAKLAERFKTFMRKDRRKRKSAGDLITDESCDSSSSDDARPDDAKAFETFVDGGWSAFGGRKWPEHLTADPSVEGVRELGTQYMLCEANVANVASAGIGALFKDVYGRIFSVVSLLSTQLLLA